MKYEVIDNKSKHTYLFIHGYGSDLNFIKDLPKHKNNFNLVRYTFQPDVNAHIDQMYEVAKGMIKRTKASKVTIVAHSLGGALAVKLSKLRKVRRILLVAPIHPYIAKNGPYKMLAKVVNPDSKADKVIGAIAKTIALKKNPFVEKFVSPTSAWYPIVSESVLNPVFLKEMDEDYKEVEVPMSFLVGDADSIISTKYLSQYVEDLNKDLKIVEGTHNPFVNPKTYEWLNSFVPFEKRFLPNLRKIFR